MKTLRDFVRIIDMQTVVVLLLSLASTFVCLRLKLAADIPSSLVGIAIIFPIVFSINSAYRRREDALGYFATMKASAMSLYYVYRDCPKKDTGQYETIKKNSAHLIQTLTGAVTDYLANGETEAGPQFKKVYDVVSEIAASNESLRHAGVQASDISRANQYLNSIMQDFERLKNIHQYRTPVSLRSYSRIFLNTFPIVYGPYFAHISEKYGIGFGYLVAAIYCLVLVSLDNIQDDLENPFDAVGSDDIKMNVFDEYKKLF
jgi:hypothetical protein